MRSPPRRVGLATHQLAISAYLYAQEIALKDRDAETLLYVGEGLLAIATFEEFEGRSRAAEHRIQEDWEAQWSDVEPDDDEPAEELAEAEATV